MSHEQDKDMSQYFYRASAADFMKIPGSPVAYWVSARLREAFEKFSRFSDYSDTRIGLITGDNNRYIRQWSEVSFSRIGLCLSRNEAKISGRKWFPQSKGGDFRRWYGNNITVLDWSYDGHELQTRLHESGERILAHNFNLDRIFEQGITWTKISSGTFSARYQPNGFLFNDASANAFPLQPESTWFLLGLLSSKIPIEILKAMNPTLNFLPGNIAGLPISPAIIHESMILDNSKYAVQLSKMDWDSSETSWDFTRLPLLHSDHRQPTLKAGYLKLHANWREMTFALHRLEEENNRIIINAYGLQEELEPDVPLSEVTLTCNPHYRYGGNKTNDELETMLQCDTMEELVSYAIGCMMGRYSLDKPGLILASQGETLQDYLRQIPVARFVPDDDGILPLTDQEWFADDATNRFREFMRTAWGEKTLQENLDFVAESLCLHAIKPKKGEDSLDTIRRYLSSQLYKDHLRTYKKRPIYWLFSSGKHKAFECLIYLHRYNEGSLARMRTEYVIPLTAKLNSHANKLEKDIDASSSTAEKKALEKQLATLHNQQAELATFDEKLRHFADQRIHLDLDDGVKVNYGKFGDLLAEVNAITGGSDE